MLPTILARLQEGCSALAISPLERDMFFERLAMMHAAVARAGLKYPANQGEARMGAFEDGGTQADLSNLVSPSVSDQATTVTHGPGLTSQPDLHDLKPGDRVRFTMDQKDRVLKLNWVSPAGGMFMFANEHGMDALTLTRARLAERFQVGAAHLA
jgi:hypothetical protein